MPVPDDSAGVADKDKADLKPSYGPGAVSPSPFWKTFLQKMAIAARLAGKEIYRNKLRWFDLRRADYQLGKKAYDSRLPLPGQSQRSDRLDRLQNRIRELGQEVASGPSLKEKSLATLKGAGRAMKIQLLKLRRRRLLRKLGRRIAEEQIADTSLAAETGEVKAASEKLRSVNAEIQTLAAQTYVWARRPLLISAIVLGLTIIFAGIAFEQEVAMPDSSTPKEAAIAFIRALQSNQMRVARALAVGSDTDLAQWKLEGDLDLAVERTNAAMAKKFGSDSGSANTDRNLNTRFESATEKTNGDTARLVDGDDVLAQLRKSDGK